MVNISAFREASQLSASRLILREQDGTIRQNACLQRVFNWCRSSGADRTANRELTLQFRQALVATYGEQKAADAFSRFIDLRSIHAGRPLSSRQVRAVLNEADTLREQAHLALKSLTGVHSLADPAYTPPPMPSLLTSVRLAAPNVSGECFNLARAALARTTELLSEVPVTPEGREDFMASAHEITVMLEELRSEAQNLPPSPASHELQHGLSSALRDIEAKEAEVERLYVEHPFSAKNISHARQNWYKAAVFCLTKNNEAAPLQHEQTRTDAIEHIMQLQAADLLRFEDPLARVENVKEELKSLPQELEKLVHTALMGKQSHNDVRKTLVQAWKEAINTCQDWTANTHAVPLVLNGHRLTPVCTTTPAGCMQNEVGRSYSPGTGIGCYSFTEAKHAVNLAFSELTISDAQGEARNLFSGLRHAAHCAFGIKNPQERREANLARATETVKAALLANPALLAHVVEEADSGYPLGLPVRVPIVSLSLLTPDNLRGSGFVNFFKDMSNNNEKRMVREQTEAWRTLNANPLHFTITDDNGVKRAVTVQPDIVTFNFGVNSGAFMSKLPHLAGGWHVSDSINRTALVQLESRVDSFLDSRAPDKDKEIARQLFTQIRTLWENSSYKTPGNEPYKMVSRLGLLTHIIGDTPCWNCKSGKDRTGNMDVETRFLALRTEIEGRVPEPDAPLDGEQRAALRALALGSGNHELQALNTGLPGFKLEGVWANDERLGESEARAYFRGASPFVAA